MKKVFISYSHKDKGWVCKWLLPRLENNGIETHIDYRDFEIGVASVVNMERAVEKCAKILLVLTQHWINSEFTQFEGIMVQTEDPIGLKKKILPLKLDGCELPRRLQILTYADFRDKNEWKFQIERVIKQIEKDFAEVEEPVFEFPPLAEDNIDITRLPKTPYELFGRQKELRILNEAWESEDTNILSFVAYGGVGKSTLVNKWLEKMRWDNYRGAEKVFGWSFYSQGTGERVTSADKFISEALEWFGDPDPKKGSLWDKGQRLADLIRKEKTLLILDGLEPLQSGYDYEKGKIKDPALSILVTQLERNNNGLCVITTREKVAELERYDKGVTQLNLEQISKEAGRALLRVGSVQGTDGELEAASEEFGNHALAINLLGSYIHGIEGHHISNAKQIPDLDIPEEKGRQPRRVIAAFEECFGESPQIQVLRLTGLFDRPAHVDAVKAVRKGSKISGLTDKIKNLSEGKWLNLLEGLRELKLLAQKSKHNPNIIDCHPLVREHFGEKLQKNKTEAWKEAHGRLYEYYKGVPEKELPDTLEEMTPLFAAVTHGCLSGRYQETFDDMYWKRITRGNQYYIWRQLGAFGADLAAVSCFFETPWSKPASGLRKEDKAIVLNIAGFNLLALGRLSEAVEPTKVGTQLQAKQKDWENAAIGNGNLSELYLKLGEVEKAVDYASQGIKFADKSGDINQPIGQRTRFANSMLSKGDLKESEKCFIEAEKIQKENRGEEILYSQRGFQFCDLLLSQGEYKEVQKRANQTLELAKTEGLQLLTLALDKLSLGRAYMLEVLSQGKSKKVKGKGKSTKEKGEGKRQKAEGKISRWEVKAASLAKAEDFLIKSVDDFRKARIQYYLVLGLLAREELNRYKRDFDKAWGDLEETKEISERGQMNLYMADYHLEAARVCLAQGGKEKEAREHYEEASKRVEDMGYHRRDPEVLLIQAELEINEGDKKKQAKETLEKAKKQIEEMGCHRWDGEVRRLEKLELRM